MIYLVGGPPRCGKTTVARLLAEKIHFPILPADYLRVVLYPFLTKKEIQKKFPLNYIKQKFNRVNDIIYKDFTPREIIKYYKKQSRTIWPSLKACLCRALFEKDNLIIEGCQIQPNLIHQFIKNHPECAKNIRVVFLYKKSKDVIIQDLKRNDHKGYWAIHNIKKEDTFYKIAKIINLYGKYVKKEAEKYNFPVFNMEENFKNKIQHIANYLRGKNKIYEIALLKHPIKASLTYLKNSIIYRIF